MSGRVDQDALVNAYLDTERRYEITREQWAPVSPDR
jgi:hypothetical protein